MLCSLSVLAAAAAVHIIEKEGVLVCEREIDVGVQVVRRRGFGKECGGLRGSVLIGKRGSNSRRRPQGRARQQRIAAAKQNLQLVERKISGRLGSGRVERNLVARERGGGLPE